MEKNPKVLVATVADPIPTFGAEGGLARLRSLIHQQPTGPGRITDDERAYLERCGDALAASLKPAEPSEIGAEVESLLAFYPTRSIREEVVAKVALQWVCDLAHLPLDVVVSACAAYRRSDAKSAPTPGLILAIANPVVETRMFLARQVERLLTPVHLPHAED